MASDSRVETTYHGATSKERGLRLREVLIALSTRQCLQHKSSKHMGQSPTRPVAFPWRHTGLPKAVLCTYVIVEVKSCVCSCFGRDPIFLGTNCRNGEGPILRRRATLQEDTGMQRSFRSGSKSITLGSLSRRLDVSHLISILFVFVVEYFSLAPLQSTGFADSIASSSSPISAPFGHTPQ